MNRLIKNSVTTFLSCGFNRIRPNSSKNQQKWCRQFSNNSDNHFEPEDGVESWKSMEGLVRCSANYAPLSPISFLERSAKVFRDRASIVYGSVKYTWEETYVRCVKLASALTQLGISQGDVVSFFPNFFFSFFCFYFFYN